MCCAALETSWFGMGALARVSVTVGIYLRQPELPSCTCRIWNALFVYPIQRYTRKVLIYASTQCHIALDIQPYELVGPLRAWPLIGGVAPRATPKWPEN